MIHKTDISGGHRTKIRPAIHWELNLRGGVKAGFDFNETPIVVVSRGYWNGKKRLQISYSETSQPESAYCRQLDL
jgi:hypothetical protein